ncbi:MAG TPA: hypothetical protein VMN39_08420, partial [Longimicrobiaceae bacterium]|nr:hypothetical protein [Longimicrobiaceae bacterium]
MTDPTVRAVPTLEAPPAVAAVDRGIVRALAYADVFDYPLGAREVHRYLVQVTAPPPVVKGRLGALVASRRIARGGDLYTLPGRESLVATRRRREETAARLWPEAIRWGRALAGLPFVRMVAVTGSLASDNVEPGGDIDYLVVTAAGRVWVGRAMTNLVRRRALRRGVRLCPNFVLSEESLLIRDRNLYTAHELAQMVPIAGRAVYRRMIATNGWTREYLPNLSAEARLRGDVEGGKGWLARGTEAVLRTPVGA